MPSQPGALADPAHFRMFEADIQRVTTGPACYVLAMIALTILLLAFTWLVISIFAGWLLYRLTRRRLTQLALTLFMLWLPFWDVIPGVILFNKAVREVGGVRIYRTVEAEGYLNRWYTDCLSCWDFLSGSGYDYMEFERTRPYGVLSSIETEPGFYEYRLFPRGDLRCAPFESLPNAERIASMYGIHDQCISFVVRRTPISRYEFARAGERYGNPRMPWQVFTDRMSVRDRVSGDLLAESVQVHFPSWLGQRFEASFWSYDELPDGSYLGIRIQDVLKPPQRNQ